MALVEPRWKEGVQAWLGCTGWRRVKGIEETSWECILEGGVGEGFLVPQPECPRLGRDLGL